MQNLIAAFDRAMAYQGPSAIRIMCRPFSLSRGPCHTVQMWRSELSAFGRTLKTSSSSQMAAPRCPSDLSKHFTIAVGTGCATISGASFARMSCQHVLPHGYRHGALARERASKRMLQLCYCKMSYKIIQDPRSESVLQMCRKGVSGEFPTRSVSQERPTKSVLQERLANMPSHRVSQKE